ncbi:MAG: Hsp70 family protein [Planctomycetes bacterium]|nr:Hsp70 family protein [Planctomycetota bacterium]
MTEAVSGPVVVGIDLGTTYSLAAVMTRHGPRVLRDQDGEALIPSVVAFEPDGTLRVGRAALARALDLPDRTVHSIKRLIGRAGVEIDAEAKRLPYRVRRGARDLARVVMTVPAYFDDAQRQATKDAATLAGLDCRRIVNEPTAAALAYGIDGSRDGTVLVYDLGGGTFDVSILRIQGGVFRVLATAGDTHLGGDDFDLLLAGDLLAASGATAVVEDSRVKQALRRAAEALKIRLSDAESAQLELDLSTGRTTTVHATRADFERRIATLVERTIDCCRRALSDAELDVGQLDDVVLVGGSSRIPLVRRRVAEFAQRAPRTDVDPDLAIALGAAIQADVLAGGNRALLLLDVVPLSLGIETMGGVVSKLVLRNATIPTSVTEEFSTQVDGQTAVDLNVYQGERERTADCRKLASFKLRGIPPMPAGLPRVAVTFLVDADGVLRVTAVEKRTGVQASIQVVPSFGLTRDEVRSMMSAAIEHARDDMAARELVELRNKGLAMVHGTRRALELADLPPDEVYSVKKAVAHLDRVLAAGAPVDELRAATDALSRLTAQIADDVIGSAVKKALGDTPLPKSVLPGSEPR